MSIELQHIADPIKVIADVPSRKPQLGFQGYADAIAAAVRGENLLNSLSAFMVLGGVGSLHY